MRDDRGDSVSQIFSRKGHSFGLQLLSELRSEALQPCIERPHGKTETASDVLDLAPVPEAQPQDEAIFGAQLRKRPAQRSADLPEGPIPFTPGEGFLRALARPRQVGQQIFAHPDSGLSLRQLRQESFNLFPPQL